MDSSEQQRKESSSSENEPAAKSRYKTVKIGAVVAVGIGIVILAYPFIPYLRFQLFPPNLNSIESEYQTDSSEELVSGLPLSEDKQVSEDYSGNRVIIPKIGVNAKIVEGENDQALLRGAWHMPQTSTPDKGSNTVITGHRFRFLPPNNTTFYLLDKLEKDDIVTVVWEGKEYYYRVIETKVVSPDQTEVINASKESILTLFTCTPLFTSQKRHVVISELI
ncbi:sortase [Patescibacteria group bacterium]|nr:sortase [Patescibacteria group bacterium]